MEGHLFGLLLIAPKAGNSQRKLASLRLVPNLRVREDGCGRRRDFSQMLKILLVRKREEEGVIALQRSALAARGFFLNDLLCFQGRDASDQHIEDVVLKMLQGEGRGGNNSSSQARASPSFRSLFKWP